MLLNRRKNADEKVSRRHHPAGDGLEYMTAPPPRGNWHVRLPLWAQTTILILIIGLTSIIVLVVISAAKVYHYSENLIRSRLSNLAGMTALQIERTFSSDLSFVSLYLTNPDVIEFFRRANSDALTLDDMFGFESRLTVDSTMSTLWGITYYTSNLTRFYTWQRRGMVSSIPVGVERRFPFQTNPLSFDELADPFLDLLGHANGNALANYTFTTYDYKDNTINYGYSVTQEVYNSATPLRMDGYRGYADTIGYITFSFLLPIQTDSPSLSDKGETGAFGKYTYSVVRERDLNLNTTDEIATSDYYGGLDVPPRSFRFTLPDGGLMFNVSEFPVVSDAFLFMKNHTSDVAWIPATSYNASSSDLNVTVVQHPRHHQGLIVKFPAANQKVPVWDSFGRQVAGGAQGFTLTRNSTGNSTATNSSTAFPGVGMSTSTAKPSASSTTSSVSTAALQTSIPESGGDVIGRPTYATLRTLSPFVNVATVGYSFALIANEKWLVFAEVSRKQAFSEVVYVVDSTIYVGLGVLGLVLLIVLPLSRWQTRGVYLIYENMRVRPLFLVEHDADSLVDEDGAAAAITHTPQFLQGKALEMAQNSGSADSPHHYGQVCPVEAAAAAKTAAANAAAAAGTAGTKNKICSKALVALKGFAMVAMVPLAIIRRWFALKPHQQPTPPFPVIPAYSSYDDSKSSGSMKQTPLAIPSLDTSSVSSQASQATQVASRTSTSEGRYRFTVPLPLPQLNRWYTDELDELVDEFNLMVKKLNSHYHHLEDQVKMRTREAQRSGELREKANVAKSEFIAIISHELRTPLNGIMGLTAVNADETDITKIRSGLETIIESGRILMDLLNELLVLSKSLVGVDPAVTEFSPSTLLEMLSNLFLSRTKSSLIADFSLGCEPPQLSTVRMRGDVDHVVQICVNFMSNANKFSELNGNASVILHCRPLIDSFVDVKPYNGNLDGANAVLEILVTDSGTGISRDQLARIFDLFVQGDNPLRKNHKGAGLGMALSKQLAEGIGGYVTVFSVEDIGSTVALRVPVQILDLTSDEIMALNGPLLEFRVPDVYSTMSLNPGEVRLIPEITEFKREPSPPQRQATNRNARHSRNTSIGSRMLLTRGGNSVTKLLRSQSLHAPHNSYATNNSKSSSSTLNDDGGATPQSHNTAAPSAATSVMAMPTNAAVGGAVVHLQPQDPSSAAAVGSIEGILGTHARNSATSLLLNHPQESHSLAPDLTLVNPSHQTSRVQSTTSLEKPDVLTNVSSRNSSAINITVNAPHMIEPGSSKAGTDINHTTAKSSDLTSKGGSVPDTNFERSGGAVHYPKSSSVMMRIDERLRPTPLHIPIQSELHPPFTYGDQHRQSPYPPNSAVSAELSPAKSDSQIKHMRVLLAEDNHLNQQIMVKMLQQLGVLQVDTADDGNSVIAMVEKSIVDGFHYHVIFMDLSMPGKNGIEATQIIRGTLGYPYPIVALTGFSDSQTINACLEVNIEEVLTKPVMKNDIMRVLRRCATFVAPQH